MEDVPINEMQESISQNHRDNRKGGSHFKAALCKVAVPGDLPAVPFEGWAGTGVKPGTSSLSQKLHGVL